MALQDSAATFSAARMVDGRGLLNGASGSSTALAGDGWLRASLRYKHTCVAMRRYALSSLRSARRRSASQVTPWRHNDTRFIAEENDCPHERVINGDGAACSITAIQQITFRGMRQREAGVE